MADPNGWRPIADAPRDGSRLLGWWPPVGFGDDNGWIGISQWAAPEGTTGHWTNDGQWLPGPEPVFWQPLPAPPAQEEGK